MKVFVSWSGKASHTAAAAFKNWLPKVIQSVEVFLSSEDIAKGSNWFYELDTVLDESRFAIICLTPENANRPWILYEAGAVSRSFKGVRVVPLLIGFSSKDLQSPLSHFNAALPTKDEVWKLLRSLNDSLEEKKLSPSLLQDSFEIRWPALETTLQQAKEATQSKADALFDYDVFLSTPMAGIENDAEYQSLRLKFKKVFDALVDQCGLKVFWAAKDIVTMRDFDTVDISAEQDMRALAASRNFMLIYPKKLVTSALFEAGYAFAMHRPCHYFVRDRSDLPFLMRELPGPFDQIRIHEDGSWDDCDDLAHPKVKAQLERLAA